MASWARLATVPAILILFNAFLPVSLRAGTDANGFFDTYLTAISYDAQGSNPPADQIDQDYLCDGDENESEILPEEGMVLVDPSLVIQQDCGDVPVAGRPFDENALLVAGDLPIRADTINNSTLDFRGLPPNQTGIGLWIGIGFRPASEILCQRPS